MDFDGVIFDCDGTLVDSETISLGVLVEMISEVGLVIAHDDAMRRFAGGDLPKVFEEIEGELGKSLPDDFLDQYRSRQMPALASSVRAISGARELLQSLSIPFCVASNAPLEKVRVCLETSGLLDLVSPEQLHSAYEVHAWKPAPDVFLKAAMALNVGPTRCAVVEDSKFGVEAGLRAGMYVFALDPHDTLVIEDENHVTKVRSLEQLRQLLKG